MCIRDRTNLCISAEHFFSEKQQYLFQVGERYVFVYIQRFYLMEETVCTVADSFVTVYTSRTDDADRQGRSS